MGCGCGGNQVKNVIQNRIARNSNRINVSSNNVQTNNSTSVQSLSAQNIPGSLSSEDRAKEKKRREILLKKLGRV